MSRHLLDITDFSADELRVRAHEYGAARCLWRHCPSCELMAAVRAVLGCPDGGELSPRLTFGGRVLDGETRDLIDPESILGSLTNREFLLLCALMEHGGRQILPCSATPFRSLAIEPAREFETIEGQIEGLVHRRPRKLRCPSGEIVQTSGKGEHWFAPQVTSA